MTIHDLFYTSSLFLYFSQTDIIYITSIYLHNFPVFFEKTVEKVKKAVLEKKKENESITHNVNHSRKVNGIFIICLKKKYILRCYENEQIFEWYFIFTSSR